MIDEEKIQELNDIAKKIRQSVIEMLTEAGSGHTASPLGMAEIYSAFYFHILNHKPEDPEWEDRDRFILSCGHTVPVRYAAMAHAGYFRVDELKTLRKLGSRLQGHPEREKLPGLETTSGPLGSGLGQASGIALAAKMNNRVFKIYCLMSDAEQQIGNVWESVMFAGKNKLDNLIVLVDKNEIQIGGSIQDVMPIEPFREKYESFNWHVIEADGNNVKEIIEAVDEAKQIKKKPTLIIINTIPGKGVKSIEGDYTWHGKAPKPEEAKRFLEELK